MSAPGSNPFERRGQTDRSVAKQAKPWTRRNPVPARERTTLSEADKAAAKARALKAGRPYPNLVDNMWAAAQARARASELPAESIERSEAAGRRTRFPRG